MWNAVSSVTSVLTLIAFMAAIAASILFRKMRQQERIISSTRPVDRPSLIQTLSASFHVDTAGLSAEERYRIVLEQLRGRGTRFMIAAILTFGICLFTLVGILIADAYRQRLEVSAGTPEITTATNNAHVTHVEYGKFGDSENARLKRSMALASQIDILAFNLGNFPYVFRNELKAFFARPGTHMRLLLASPDSSAFSEENAMNHPKEWTGRELTADSGTIARSEQMLREDIPAGTTDRIEFRHFNTQYRMPMIIIDGNQCFLTVRLPPDEAPQSLRIEATQDTDGKGLVPSCVAHWDRMWAVSLPER
jgi:hypothetical protein